MSSGVLIVKSEDAPVPVEQMFREFVPTALGEVTKVREKISNILPKIDLSDTAWRLFFADDYSIEFNFQEQGQIDCLMLHVRAGEALKPIIKLCTDDHLFIIYADDDYVFATGGDVPGPSLYIYSVKRDKWLGLEAVSTKLVSEYG
jgi:hypothetical protein